MLFIIIPLVVIIAIGLGCINFKLGFIVSDLTEKTGFNAGFYMMTVFGLFAVEISLAMYLTGVKFDG